jgi:hypothetical protein
MNITNLTDAFIDSLFDNEYFIEKLQNMNLIQPKITYNRFINYIDSELITLLNSTYIDHIEIYSSYIVRACNENRLTPHYFELSYPKPIQICRLLIENNCKINNLFDLYNNKRSIAYCLIHNCYNYKKDDYIKTRLDYNVLLKLFPVELTLTELYFTMQERINEKYFLFDTCKISINFIQNVNINAELLYKYISRENPLVLDYKEFVEIFKKYNYPLLNPEIITNFFQFYYDDLKIKTSWNTNTFEKVNIEKVSMSIVKFLLINICNKAHDQKYTRLIKYCEQFSSY